MEILKVLISNLTQSWMKKRNAQKIPSEGRNLNECVRYYTYDRDGNVAGVYIIPGVEGVKAICNSREPETACTVEERRIWMAQPGTRLWLKDFKLIPGMDDGGCDYIELEFDTSTNRVSELKCNALH